MQLKTLLNEVYNKNIVNEFVKFTAKELQLKSLPAKIKMVGSDYSKQHLTFGTYQPDNDEIVIVKNGRHMVDTLRTLAHELVHHKQREEQKELDGTDGSEIENEANAMAGTLLRKFRYLYPEMYSEK
jgi:Zn-dependent peptidase ImmA (M78 family)